MPDKTTQDKIAAIDNVLFDLEDYAFHGGLTDKSPDYISEYKRIAKQLERRKQRLLNPQPKARKPKTEILGDGRPVTPIEYTPTEYKNSKPRTGRGNG